MDQHKGPQEDERDEVRLLMGQVVHGPQEEDDRKVSDEEVPGIDVEGGKGDRCHQEGDRVQQVGKITQDEGPGS